MRTFATVAFAMLALLGLVVGGVPRATRASSHREAPLISHDPQADATDVYAWISPDRPDAVTLIANYIPFEVGYGGPNFYRFGDDVLYEINVDNDGDAVDDITFQFRFRNTVRNPNTFLYNTGAITSLEDPDLNQVQYYSVSVLARQEPGNEDPYRCGAVIAKDLPVAPAYVGPKSYPEGYGKVAMQAVRDIGRGIKVFAGPRDDPFFVDLGGTFDLLSGIRGRDDLNGLNVHTIAIQVPIAGLKGPNDSVIGVRTTSHRRSMTVVEASAKMRAKQSEDCPGSGGVWKQVSRLGMPLVNEVVMPLALKDAFNTLKPYQDAQIFTSGSPVGNLLQKSVLDPELARLLTGILGLKVPPAPRNDILTIFLTGIGPVPGVLPNGLNQPAKVVPSEQIRLNMAIPPSGAPNRLGLLGGDAAGFPNGRRPLDDVVDIEFRVVAGATPFTPGFEANNQLGDNVNANDQPFMGIFPYLAEPNVYPTAN